jgi:hypothetical protein
VTATKPKANETSPLRPCCNVTFQEGITFKKVAYVNNSNNNNNNIYQLQLGCHPMAVINLHFYYL